MYIYIYQEGMGKRTEPAEPNRTVLFGTGTNRAISRTEPNRTD